MIPFSRGSSLPIAAALAAFLVAAPAGAATKLRIVSGQQSQSGAVLQQIFSTFNAGSRDISVDLELDNKSDVATTQKILADIVAGTAPDAVRVTGAVLRPYVDSGRARPLDDCLKTAPALAATLDQGLLASLKVNGKLYAMPFYTTLPALFLNRDAFVKAGLDPDKAPATWSELEKDASLLSDKASGRYGLLMYMPNTYLFESQLLSAGGHMTTAGGKPSIDSPQAMAVLAFMRDLVEKGYMPAISPGTFWGEFGARFEAGDIAMLLTSSSSFLQLSGKAPFKLDVAPMPIRDGGALMTAASSNGFVMLATDPDRQAATCKALLSLVTPENVALTVKATASSPVNLAASNDPALLGDFYRHYPSLKAVNEQPNTAWYALPGRANGEFQSLFADTQFQILTGAVTVEDGLADLQQRMDELLTRD